MFYVEIKSIEILKQLLMNSTLKIEYLEVITMIDFDLISLILGLVIGLAVGVIALLIYYNLGFSKKKTQIETDSENAINEANALLAKAEKDGESRKRELLLQAKEKINKTKHDLEMDARSRQSSLDKERNRIEQKESELDKRSASVDKFENKLKKTEEEIQAKYENVSKLEEEQITKLEEIAGLTVEQAKDNLMSSAELVYRRDLAVLYQHQKEEIDAKAERYAEEAVVTAMQRYASDYVSDNTVSVVTLPNDEMKGRIIGREGRNIKSFQNITGVDVIIDDTPEAVILSCFNPIRREIAVNAMERLVKDGRVHPTSIEAAVEKAEKDIGKTIREEGERAALSTGLVGITNEEVELLGRLHYRTSFGQNVLQHSLEVAELAASVAAELGLNIDIAKRVGLFHDIGKAVDFEREGSHVDLGVEIAKRNGESDIVVDAIASHHGDVETTSIYGELVIVADTLSAARPGARRESVESYVKRIQSLEDIANGFDGVDKSYAIQAGRELRVIVKPEEMSEAEMELTAYEIAKRIEEELNYPGQIKVNMIRETRYESLAK